MPTKSYYLRQAQDLFDLAAKMSVKADALRLIARANEYQLLADAMPADHELPVRPTPPPSTVSQPMQQQQQNEKPTEDKAE